jgi:hypothetical protein
MLWWLDGLIITILCSMVFQKLRPRNWKEYRTWPLDLLLILHAIVISLLFCIDSTGCQ